MKKLFTKILLLALLIPASLLSMDTKKTVTLVGSDKTTVHVQKNIANMSRFMAKNPAGTYHMNMDEQNLKHCVEIMKIAHKYKQYIHKHETYSLINNAITEYIKEQIPKHKINKLSNLIKALFVLKIDRFIFGIVIHNFIDKLKREYKGARKKIEVKITEKFVDLKLRSKIFAAYYIQRNSK